MASTRGFELSRGGLGPCQVAQGADFSAKVTEMVQTTPKQSSPLSFSTAKESAFCSLFARIPPRPAGMVLRGGGSWQHEPPASFPALNSLPAPSTATALEAHPVTRRHPRPARASLCLFLSLYFCSPRWLRTAGASRCSFPNVYYLFIVIYNLPLPRRCLCRESNYLCFLVKSIKSLKAGTRAQCLTRAISGGPTSPGGAAGEEGKPCSCLLGDLWTWKRVGEDLDEPEER